MGLFSVYIQFTFEFVGERVPIESAEGIQIGRYGWIDGLPQLIRERMDGDSSIVYISGKIVFVIVIQGDTLVVAANPPLQRIDIIASDIPG